MRRKILHTLLLFEQLEDLFVKTAIYEIIKEETTSVMIQRTIGSLCIGFPNQWFLDTLCPDDQGLKTLCQVAFSRFSGKVKYLTQKYAHSVVVAANIFNQPPTQPLSLPISLSNKHKNTHTHTHTHSNTHK